MSAETPKKYSVVNKHGEEGREAERLRLAAIGLEAEFGLLVDGRPRKPERVFGTPRAFIRGDLMHRVGTSYHLPTGGAVYFDTGVIELATPVIEIERGCAARAARSLWESIAFVRGELDAWERQHGKRVQLTGFSAHYNTSFRRPRGGTDQGTVEELALLLAYILPIPVMLLAANRRSTGVGARPRSDRIEVTVDFTPDPALMVATATLVTGIARSVMRWKSFDLSELERAGIPVLRGFQPQRHTTRRGWLARHTCFPANPFTADPDAATWETTDGRTLSLREVGRLITHKFWRQIRRISDPFTLRLIAAIMAGRAPSLLELADRPPAYDDVGHLCSWGSLYPEQALPRSRYERVLLLAIAGRKLQLGEHVYAPVGMRGWSQVVFRREGDDTRHIFSIDFLLEHLRQWERSAHVSGPPPKPARRGGRSGKHTQPRGGTT